MSNQKIADFEGELLGVCSKYEKDIPHAALAGTLMIVAHIYMDAQLGSSDFVAGLDAKGGLLKNTPFAVENSTLKGRSVSPLPAETKND